MAETRSQSHAKSLNRTNEVEKTLRKQVRELEVALVETRRAQMLDGVYLQLACRAAGIYDVDGYKKEISRTICG